MIPTFNKVLWENNGLRISRDGPIWDENTIINLESSEIKNLKLPEEDFFSEKFDSFSQNHLNDIFLLLSTPRSGSTAVCDFLYKAGKFVTHEYFQPFQYMPALASRWNCQKDGGLSPGLYVRQLVAKRVGENGVLGINLHGSHLNVYKYFEGFFDPSIPKCAIVLKRKDKIAQAVSYYIASCTSKWSSYYEGLNGDEFLKYSFSGIKSKLISILNQEALYEEFLAERSIHSHTIFYEEILEGPQVMDSLIGHTLDVSQIDLKLVDIVKQRNELNASYAESFAEDFGVISNF